MRCALAVRQFTVLWSLVIVAITGCGQDFDEFDPPSRAGNRRDPDLDLDIVNAPDCEGTTAPRARLGAFSTQTRLGCTLGDQWEPALAADGYGHVYALGTQYYGVPGCADCTSRTTMLYRSADGGDTWDPPRPLVFGTPSFQYDPQIEVDPVGGRTVYAVWMRDNKANIEVARSDDFGDTWVATVADDTNAAADKPILLVQGDDVYVGFNVNQMIQVASSHDGAQTFDNVALSTRGLGWSLPAGGTIDSLGRVFFGWAGYTANGNANGPVNIYVTTSADGGASWTRTLIDVSERPPTCDPQFDCGWAFLGPQVVLAVDETDTLYAAYNAGRDPGAPNRLYLTRSTVEDRGAWQPPINVSLAPEGTNHGFPVVLARGEGEVYLAWMDSRAGGLWNVYLRYSTDGGATWSDEQRVSSYVDGFDYILPEGFLFPYGDYYEMNLLQSVPAGTHPVLHVVMGQGESWTGTGSIWYTRSRLSL